jgi:hypothetical protein
VSGGLGTRRLSPSITRLGGLVPANVRVSCVVLFSRLENEAPRPHAARTAARKQNGGRGGVPGSARCAVAAIGLRMGRRGRVAGRAAWSLENGAGARRQRPELTADLVAAVGVLGHKRVVVGDPDQRPAVARYHDDDRAGAKHAANSAAVFP